jgi:hypothetical protein
VLHPRTIVFHQAAQASGASSRATRHRRWSRFRPDWTEPEIDRVLRFGDEGDLAAVLTTWITYSVLTAEAEIYQRMTMIIFGWSHFWHNTLWLTCHSATVPDSNLIPYVGEIPCGLTPENASLLGCPSIWAG